MSNFVLVNSPTISPQWAPRFVAQKSGKLTNGRLPRRVSIKAFFFNPLDEPILKEAFKEPVAFMGGMFAGLLRLDLNEEPLKDWINRTVEASGITEEEIDSEGANTEEEETPQQIDIE